MSIFPNDKQQGAPYAEAHRLLKYTHQVSVAACIMESQTQIAMYYVIWVAPTSDI